MIQDMSTIYGFKKQVESHHQGSKHTLAILMSKLRSSLGAAWEQLGSSLEYAYSMLMTTFLRPFSSKRAELERRLASDEITARASRDYGSSLTRLRLVVSMLLLLIVGSGNVWGQTPDRSGIFYFVNYGSGKSGDSKITDITNPDDYFYLVPADNPQLDNKRDAWFSSDYSSAIGDSEKPFLTTYRTKKDEAVVPEGVTNRPHNSVWIVKFASTDSGTDYYYLIHAATGKYVVYEPPYASKNNRKSMHLLTTDSPGENAKFAITLNSEYYNFRPKSIDTGASTNKYLNPTQQNYNYYYSSDATADGNANYYRGLIGLWKNNGTNTDGTGSDWRLEATLLSAPNINFDPDTNKFSISYDKLPNGYTILYTINGSNPTIGGATTSTYSGSPILVTESIKVKAVVVRYGMVLTEMAEKDVAPVPCAKPVITYNNTNSNVSITCTTVGSTIYYTTDGSTPNSSSTEYSNSFSVGDQTTIKAIAIKSEFIDSEIASVKVVLTPTITLANEYTYSGSDIEPEVSSVKDGETTIATSEYTVSYSNNINAGTEAVVTITDNPGGDFIIFGSTTFTINPKAVTITANDASKTYDGTALTENGFTASALETGDTHTFTVSMTEGSTITNAGTQPNVIAMVDGTAVTTGTEAVIGNYKLTTVNGMLTISPKSIGDGNTAADGIIIEMTSEGDLSSVKDGETTLVLNTDYTYTTETVDENKVVTITGIGNYQNSAKGIYANPPFIKPEGESSAAAVYTAMTDLANPTGIKPYIIRKVNPSIGTMVISELDYIPEGVPVLLLSSAEVDGFVTSPKNPSTPEVADGTKNSNQLKVSQGGETVQAAQIYMFYQGEFMLTKAGTLGEGKYFLYNPNYNAQAQTAGGNSGSASSRGSLQFVFDDEATGISELNNSKIEEKETDVWYTLEGQRIIGKPSKGGIYIRKGQKIFLKRN